MKIKRSNLAAPGDYRLDTQLSISARGLMVSLLAITPANGEICLNLKAHCQRGREWTSNRLNELIAFGYIVRSDIREQNGLFSPATYTLTEAL
jgi:hypothetical protein